MAGTPMRLPRPGMVVEPCRLCGSALTLSVENPKRICAACGEVNLPNDAVPLTGPLRLPVVKNPFRKQDFIQVGVGAATPLLALLSGVLRDWRGSLGILIGAFEALGPLTLVSLVVLLVHVVRANRLRLVVPWMAGVAAGLFLSGVFVYLSVIVDLYWRR